MLFLVSGASCAGKTTARRGALPLLGDRFVGVELRDLCDDFVELTVAWRQKMVEVAVQLAQALEREGRHLLLAGDPVPAAEMWLLPRPTDSPSPPASSTSSPKYRPRGSARAASPKR